jgi:hypothetical protein
LPLLTSSSKVPTGQGHRTLEEFPSPLTRHPPSH